jgi:predicted DNA-binding transcriptional regulator AlpA
MSDYTVLADMPDHVVLTRPQVRAITTLSDDTLDRLHRAGEGPERIQLSARRIGYRAGALRTWLQKRSS